MKYIIGILLVVSMIGCVACGSHKPKVVEQVYTGTADLQLNKDNGVLSIPVSIQSTDGFADVYIPKDTTVPDSISVSKAENIPQTKATVVEAYNMEPSGTIFSNPITVTMSYSGISDDEAQKLQIAYYDGSKWIGLDSSINKWNNTISCKVDHFTLFGLIESVVEVEPTQTPTAEPTAEPTVSPTPEVTVEPTPEETVTPTVEPIPDITPDETIEPTSTPEVTSSPTPEETPETTEVVPYEMPINFLNIEPITSTTISLYPNDSTTITYRITNYYFTDVLCPIVYSISPPNQGITISGATSVLVNFRTSVEVIATIETDNSVVPGTYTVGIEFGS